ncbi:MAG: hypothetical protein ACYTBJ_00870 [Planctomycetota bacterium]|jgi:hypothetical protein
MDLNEAKIQKLLFCEYAPGSLVVPNCHFRNGRWEMDVFRVTPAGLSYEYEIKMNKADFRNELKHKKMKHRYMDVSPHMFANYYSFVCPTDVIPLEDVFDDRYGLFYVNGYYIRCIRKPKKLHDGRVEQKYHWALAKKLMFKYFNHADKYCVRRKQ